MNQPSLLIFIPTFNERANVEPMARELQSLGLQADILFLDDGSPDGTGEILDGLAQEIPQMRVIHRQGKQGIGSAHQVGIAYAYEHGYDVLVTLDCDFTHKPQDIPRLLEALQGFDAAVGSRYMAPDSLPGWHVTRRLLTLFGHLLTTRLLRMPHDASGAFRAYDLRRVNRNYFKLVMSSSYPFFFESLFVLVQNGVRINETPIVLPARTYGSSKMTLKEAYRGGLFLLRLWVESLSNPERFRLGRAPDALLEEPSPTQWDGYWLKKESKTGLLYEFVAAAYRKLFIRPNLKRALKKHFAEGSSLLHAGCGSGQADVSLHDYFNITAVDYSLPALAHYSRNNPKAFRIEQADIFNLGFASGSFDGVFNLGVMEHYTEPELHDMLVECKRVLKPGGKIVMFWPHQKSTSVFVLRVVHVIMRQLLGKKEKLHPDEFTLIANREHAAALLESAGLQLADYNFDGRDFWVQAVVVGTHDGAHSGAAVSAA